MSIPHTPRTARRAHRRRRARRRTFLVGAAVVVLLSGAVGAFALTRSDESKAQAEPSAPKVTTTTLPPTTTTTRDPRRGLGVPVTIAFAGDVHFEGPIRTKLAENPSGMFAPIAPALSIADLAIVNFESAITEQNTPIPKEFNFRSPPSSLVALQGAGVDLVNQANNHSVDFGPQGLADTLAAKATSPIPVIGVGANAIEAYTPFITEIRGQRIAIFGATDVMGEEHVASWTATDTQPGIASTKYEAEARMIAAIQYVRPSVDTLVVFLHWGVERVNCPSERQKALAAALVAAGADVVVGSHAHVLEGAGRLGTAFVGYGLGNFAFYNEIGENGRTGVLILTITGRDTDSYQWVPARIRGGIPTPVPTGPEADAEIANWNSLRACTDLLP
jgi:poly-gamma-glutamate synthesis protein (capsule biosynthesis protein)